MKKDSKGSTSLLNIPGALLFTSLEVRIPAIAFSLNGFKLAGLIVVWYLATHKLDAISQFVYHGSVGVFGGIMSWIGL